jgi:cytochrome b561
MTEHDQTKPAGTQPGETGGKGIELVGGRGMETETARTTRGKGEADEERLTAAQPPASQPPRSQPAPSQPAPSQPPAVARYDVVSPIFHWLLVLLVLGQLGLGWSLHYWPGAIPERQAASWVHISLGLSIGILAFAAVFWRLTFASVRYSELSPAWVRPTERAIGIILYFLLILMPLTGYLSLVFAGKAVSIWNWTVPTWGWKDADLSDLYGRWHYGAAIVLSGAFVVHILVVVVASLQERWAARSRKRASQAIIPPEPKVAPVRQGPTAETRGLAFNLRIFGWLGFWAQLCLGLLSVLLLIVTASSKYYSESTSLHIRFLSWAQGVFWAHLATALLALTVIGFFYCTRLAKGLRGGVDPASCQRRITRLVSGINFGSSLGLTLSILGTSFSIALLIAKTVAQPPGIAITDPQKIVRAVDVFVLLANFNIVVAHFVGILTCLWMLNRVHRFYLPLELARAAAGSEDARQQSDVGG